VRRFILLVHKVPIDGAFTLNDLAGGAGRMDEVARAVSTAFTVSNDLRRDTEVTLLFAGPVGGIGRRISVVGSRLRYLNPDERSTAALLKNALTRSVDHLREFESSPGMVIGAADPRAELARWLKEPGAVWLTEGGMPLRTFAWEPPNFLGILCDPFDPTPEEHAALVSAGLPQVSVGPRSLRTSQVIDVVHAELDQREPALSKPPE
jgi:tRNA (pseudouridine54-N1)-methyltransferase